MPRVLAPIAVYVYDRVAHFKQCIVALQKNSLAEQSEVYIVSDAAKHEGHRAAVDEIREYARTVKGFRKVHFMFRPENMGVFLSPTRAEREIVTEHGRLISVEDDVITAPDFLKFINDALDFYADNKQIFSVSGYSHPVNVENRTNHSVWFSYWPFPWGYGTWKDRYLAMDFSRSRWSEIKGNKQLYKRFIKYGDWLIDVAEADHEGRMVAADMRQAIEMFLRGMHTVVPYRSKVQNIGLDGSGFHCGITDRFRVDIETPCNGQYVFPEKVSVNHEMMLAINKFMRAPNYRRTRRILKWLGLHDSARYIYRRIRKKS